VCSVIGRFGRFEYLAYYHFLVLFVGRERARSNCQERACIATKLIGLFQGISPDRFIPCACGSSTSKCGVLGLTGSCK
jgi:hypothetical protein